MKPPSAIAQLIATKLLDAGYRRGTCMVVKDDKTGRSTAISFGHWVDRALTREGYYKQVARAAGKPIDALKAATSKPRKFKEPK